MQSDKTEIGRSLSVARYLLNLHLFVCLIQQELNSPTILWIVVMIPEDQSWLARNDVESWPSGNTLPDMQHYALSMDVLQIFKWLPLLLSHTTFEHSQDGKNHEEISYLIYWSPVGHPAVKRVMLHNMVPQRVILDKTDIYAWSYKHPVCRLTLYSHCTLRIPRHSICLA